MSEQTVTVRSMRPDEAVKVGALLVAAYDAGNQFDDDDEYRNEVGNVEGRMIDNDILVAHVGSALVGTVTMILPGSPQAEISRVGECEFRFFGVARVAWGSGVGDALVRGCISWATERDLHIAIMTRDRNTPAQNLYLRNGFSRTPTRDWSPAPGVDLIAFQRPPN